MIAADAIVVLGCTLLPGGRITRALERRIELAARAFAEGVAPCIVASGGRRWHGHVEALVMRSELVARGVEASQVICELCSLSTLENGCYTAELMRRRGMRRAMIATCPWHLPRALHDFRRQGIDAVAPPAGWLPDASSTLVTRLREGVCTWLDSAMLRGS